MTIMILGVVFWALCKMGAFVGRAIFGTPLDENLKKLTKEYDKHTPEYYQEMQRQSEEEQRQYDEWGFIE